VRWPFGLLTGRAGERPNCTCCHGGPHSGPHGGATKRIPGRLIQRCAAGVHVVALLVHMGVLPCRVYVSRLAPPHALCTSPPHKF